MVALPRGEEVARCGARDSPSMTLLEAEARPLRLRTGVRSSVGVAAVLYFFMGLDNYIGNAGGPQPVTLILAFIGIALIIVLSDVGRGQPLFRSPIVGWLAFYFLLTTAWGIFIKDDQRLIQTLTDRYRSMALLSALLVLFAHPRARQTGIAAVCLATIGISLINIGELAGIFSFPAVSSPTPGRASGFFMNVNESAIAIVLGLAVSMRFVPSALRAPMLLVGLAGITATFSRGAFVCLAVLLLWMALRQHWVWSLALVAAGAVLVLAYAPALLESVGWLNTDTTARLALTQDDSGRVDLAMKAWALFLGSPIIGNGIGATTLWGEAGYAHNMYLTLAAEHGVLGLLAFPALGFAIYASHRDGVGVALVLAVAGFFSHTLLEGTYALVTMAVVAAPVDQSAVHAPADQGA